MQHLLVYLLDRRLTGTIVLETPQGERSAIALVEGVPGKAKTAQPVIHLGRLLLEMGAVDEPTLNRTLVRVAQEKVLHGQSLLQEGAIDEDVLETALREQVARKVLWMATLPPETMYGYYDGASFLESWGGPATPVEALALIWRAIRSYESGQRVEATLARLPQGELRLHPEAQPARFRFSQRDAVVIDVLRAKPQSLRELLDSELADASAVKRVVYALAVTRHLDLGGDAKPIGVSSVQLRPDSGRSTNLTRRRRRFATGSRTGSRSTTGPNRKRESSPDSETPVESPENAALRREILDRARAIPNENYYQILGLPQDAPNSAVQAAFFKLAKKWHPDRLPPDLVDVREIAMRTFARMSEAHQVLGDETRRAEYDELLTHGSGTSGEQEEVQAVMRAITCFQKAEVMLKKRNLTEAEALAKEALDSDPTQADYHALYAWILAQKPERANEQVDDLLQILDDAVRREPSNQRARFYRAQLLKRAGRPDQAIKDFRWIVEHDPKNLDALREIRLYDMRKSAAPTGPPSSKGSDKPSGGLFGKLFKR